MIFDPDSAGLRAGSFKVITDDPDGIGEDFTVVGTGTDGSTAEIGNNYIAYEDPYDGPQSTLRTRSDPGGNYELFVAAEQFFRVTAFDSSTDLISRHHDVTRPSGRSTPVSNKNYEPSVSPDTDGDGLPDDVEKVIGTNPNLIDTNDDGISDFDQVQAGLDPLSGLTVGVGEIGSARLSGEALGVTVEASGTNLDDRIAYVATGTYGLGIVDVSDPTSPIVLSEIDLTGTANAVAVDPQGRTAVVAAGAAGVHFLNVTDPTKPLLVDTNFGPVEAKFVNVFEGTAFVAAADTLYAVDVVTHDITDSLPLGGGMITGLSREGSNLFAHDASKTIRSFDVSGGKLTPLGLGYTSRWRRSGVCRCQRCVCNRSWQSGWRIHHGGRQRSYDDGTHRPIESATWRCAGEGPTSRPTVPVARSWLVI